MLVKQPFAEACQVRLYYPQQGRGAGLPCMGGPCIIQNGRASDAQHATVTQNLPNARGFPDMGTASSSVQGLMYEQAQGSFCPFPPCLYYPSLYYVADKSIEDCIKVSRGATVEEQSSMPKGNTKRRIKISTWPVKSPCSS